MNFSPIEQKRKTIYFKVQILNMDSPTEPVMKKYVGSIDQFKNSNSVREEFIDLDGNRGVKPLDWRSHVAETPDDENSLIYRYTLIKQN